MATTVPNKAARFGPLFDTNAVGLVNGRVPLCFHLCVLLFLYFTSYSLTMTAPPPNGARKISRLLAALDNPGMSLDQPESSQAAGLKRVHDASAGSLSPNSKRQATGLGRRAHTPGVGGMLSLRIEADA